MVDTAGRSNGEPRPSLVGLPDIVGTAAGDIAVALFEAGRNPSLRQSLVGVVQASLRAQGLRVIDMQEPPAPARHVDGSMTPSQSRASDYPISEILDRKAIVDATYRHIRSRGRRGTTD